jgi:hypothetical protein
MTGDAGLCLWAGSVQRLDFDQRIEAARAGGFDLPGEGGLDLERFLAAVSGKLPDPTGPEVFSDRLGTSAPPSSAAGWARRRARCSPERSLKVVQFLLLNRCYSWRMPMPGKGGLGLVKPGMWSVR